GTPLASSTDAWELTRWGMSGFLVTPLMNEADRLAMRIDPIRAVPIEVPRFDPVFWRPPTSPLLSSGTEDTVTLPSWEARAPTPMPTSRRGTVVISAPA